MDVFSIFIIVALLVANGFFVAAEFALVRVRASQIDPLVEEGNWAAKITRKVLNQLDAYISASQLGITLASLGLGRAVEDTIEPMVVSVLTFVGLDGGHGHVASGSGGEDHSFAGLGPILAMALVTFLHIGLGELVPKSLAIRTSKTIALWTAPPLMAFYFTFLPAIWLMNKFSDLVVRGIGMGSVDHSEMGHTEEELRLIVMESAGKGHLSNRERAMIENVLNLEEKTARKIMVPRPDIVYLSMNYPLEENLRLARHSGHTRFPLCETDLTNVVGMIHIKDLLRADIGRGPSFDLRKFARPIPHLPESLRLDKLLMTFQVDRVHLALLVDEFGSVVGMVTMENVLEELVGPIQDEFDRETPRIQLLTDDVYLVDAACSLEAAIETCKLRVEETEADTVGGLVQERLGRIARAGDSVTVGDRRLTVTQADPNRVRQVRIEPAGVSGAAPSASSSGIRHAPAPVETLKTEEPS